MVSAKNIRIVLNNCPLSTSGINIKNPPQGKPNNKKPNLLELRRLEEDCVVFPNSKYVMPRQKPVTIVQTSV
jgi:hypothetical protein